jgi:hypothetical protein
MACNDKGLGVIYNRSGHVFQMAEAIAKGPGRSRTPMSPSSQTAGKQAGCPANPSKNIIATLLLIFSLTTLNACDFGDLTLTVQFTEINGLATGDRILYQNGYIGDVEKIARTGAGHYLVELDIDADHKQKLTVHSLIYIATDPDRPTQKAVFTEQEKPGGLPLTDNSTVVGLDHPPRRQSMPDNHQQ